MHSFAYLLARTRSTLMSFLSARVLLAFFFILSPVHALYNGGQSRDKDGVRSFTVAIETPDSLCSGTLIGERLIITAAHCLEKSGVYRVHYLNSQFRPVVMAVNRVAQHPDYNVNDGFSADDVGLVETTKPFPKDLTPVQLASFFTWVREGENVIIAGFGSTEKKNAKDGILREAAMRASPPAIPKDNFAGLASLSSFKVGMCVGDSGGPVFRPASRTLIGILKGGSPELGQECTSNPIYMPVRSYITWIKMVADRWGANLGE